MFKNSIIMLCSGWSTFLTLSRFWIAKLRGQADRRWVDVEVRRWANNLLDIVKTQVIFEGDKPVYQAHQAYILMSNHASLYDIPIIYAQLPGSIRMIAKKELSRIPYFGTSLKHSEFIFIDRKNRPQAIQDLKRANKKMQDGIIIWAAPEGTRSRTGDLGIFKKGIFKLAMQTKAHIIPIGIRGARDLLPAKTWQFKTGQTIHVRAGAPIDTQNFTNQEEADLIDQVRQQILTLSTR